MESDRQGRAPRGPYFFFFLVAFFFATASPPFAETLERRICSAMLVMWKKSVKAKSQYLGVGKHFTPQDVGSYVN